MRFLCEHAQHDHEMDSFEVYAPALEAASGSGHMDIVPLLTNLDNEDYDKRALKSALKSAAGNGHLVVVRCLIAGIEDGGSF